MYGGEAPTVPSVLRDLDEQLKAIETAAIRTNLELKVARLEAAEGRESTHRLLDRALASIEHLNEITAATSRQLDDLLKA
jgi:hypothetical protein